MSALDRIFSQTSVVPPPPHAVSKLLARLEHPDAEAKRVSSLLGSDPLLAAKVLRIANSSSYGAPGAVGSVAEALQLLGLVQMQMIVIACDVAGAFAVVKHLSPRQFWHTSLLAALIARALAMKTTQNPNLAFTAGLMHGIGQLLIHGSLPELGDELDTAVAQGDFQGRRMAEHEVLGVDHCEIGAELARRWKLPAQVANAIRYYADPDAKAAQPLSRLLYVGATIAHAIEREEETEVAIAAIPPQAMRVLAIDAETLQSQVEGFKALVNEVAEML